MNVIFKAGIVLIIFSAFTQQELEPSGVFCGIKNTAFKADEVITMKVFYNSLGLYIGAGEATFTSSLERFNGRTVYHCVGEGKSYSFFDNFFKVRDRYETFIDTANMFPVKFVRNVDEGRYKI